MRGPVYLEIMVDANGFSAGPQMVGAEFEEATAQKVFDHIQGTHRLAEEARQKRLGRSPSYFPVRNTRD